MPDACRGQKRTLDHLGLESQKVVSYHVGAGNKLNLCPLEEQPGLLTTGLSLQLNNFTLMTWKLIYDDGNHMSVAKRSSFSISYYSPDRTGTYFIAQGSLELMSIPLLQTSECWLWLQTWAILPDQRVLLRGTRELYLQESMCSISYFWW